MYVFLCLEYPQLFLTRFLLATGSFSSAGAAITAVTSSEGGEDSTTVTSTETVRLYSEHFPARITH